MSRRQLAYLFDEVGEMGSKDLGGKAFGLVKMTKLGMPVPPGFVVLTGASRAFLQEGRLPKRLAWQLKRGIALLERKTGKKFGSEEDPLFVSVRSGAAVSMPGMMDTILNLGLNKTTLRGLAEEIGEENARKTLKYFQENFEEQTGHSLVDNSWKQLELAINAICRSWRSDRALVYRKVQGIPERLGTAVVVQAMVFGNARGLSGSGVVFSRNVATGTPELYGEYLPQAQGEELVAGVRNPEPISSLALQNHGVYCELEGMVRKLEAHYKDVVDVEFTIENGRLYLLQVRVAKRTPMAAARIAVDIVREGLITEKEAASSVSAEDVLAIEGPRFDLEALRTRAEYLLLVNGLPASGGAAVGQVCFCPQKAEKLAQAGESVILVREDTTPDDFSGILAAKAVVTSCGGVTSHAAVVARELGKPAVVGCSQLKVTKTSAVVEGFPLEEGETVSVDGETGQVVLGEVPMEEGCLDEKLKAFLSWVERYHPLPNVNWKVVEERWCVNTLLNDYYISNCLKEELKATSLAEEAVALARKVQRRVADVFVAYLILAVAGEAQYAWDSGYGISRREDLDCLRNFGVEPLGLLNHTGVQRVVMERLRSQPVGRTILFLETASRVFHEGGWRGSVGGERWARIAEAPLWYLTRRMSAGSFVDRVFDLRHNGGRLFDKHRMVSLTDEYRLSYQLSVKRHTRSLRELVEGLVSPEFSISSEVGDMYESWCTLEEVK